MTTIKAFIKRYPLPTYFALTFVISWGGMLIVAGPGGIPATPEQTDMQALFVMLAWLAGPSVAGILLTGLLYGRAGFRDFLTRMTRWRVGTRWYAVALLSAPLLFMAVLLALSLTSPEFLPGILTTGDKAALLLFGIGWGLIGGGFLEELGWTVMDRLSEIKVPTLVLAGRDDFQFPPEHQAALAAGLANARSEIIERAGHNAPTERSAEVIQAVKHFMATVNPAAPKLRRQPSRTAGKTCS